MELGFRKKHHVFWIVGICGIALFLAAFLFAQPKTGDPARMFLKGVRLYEEEKYPEAIDVFKRIVESGIKNGSLYYNLGNAYFKTGDVGRAVLWYERAKKLTPNDPDLAFNYKHALTMVKDKKEEGQAPVYRILFFWRHMVNQSTVQWIAIVMNFFFWVSVFLRMRLKKIFFSLIAGALLVFSLVFTATALYNHYVESYVRRGVILPESVTIRSGLSPESTSLFELHAGTRIRVERENKGYYRIRFSEGKIGWIKKDDAGII